MTFGDKILAQRKKLNWSQQDLADKIGTHGAVVGKYERDEIKPSVEVAKKIADVMAVSLDYLTDESDSASSLQDKQVLKRIAEIERLPEKDKEYIFQTIDMVIRDAKARNAYSSV